MLIKKYSFDLDGSLLHSKMLQALCLSLRLIPDIELIVLTRRYKDISLNDKPLMRVLKQYGFYESNIFFTDGEYKHTIIDSLNVDVHFDDDLLEIKSINANCKAHAVLIEHGRDELGLLRSKV